MQSHHFSYIWKETDTAVGVIVTLETNGFPVSDGIYKDSKMLKFWSSEIQQEERMKSL
jgi:hypothetical protein